MTYSVVLTGHFNFPSQASLGDIFLLACSLHSLISLINDLIGDRVVGCIISISVTKIAKSFLFLVREYEYDKDDDDTFADLASDDGFCFFPLLPPPPELCQTKISGKRKHQLSPKRIFLGRFFFRTQMRFRGN